VLRTLGDQDHQQTRFPRCAYAGMNPASATLLA
jgi:hypothetical protein